jgi:phosphoglycolate phosphatase
MKTAHAAGMHAVGVLWGFRPEEELRASGAQYFVRHPQEILDLFDDTGR